MSLWICLECSTAFAVGLQACPHCGARSRPADYEWSDDVAKANAYGATLYLPEGAPVPVDVPPEVRLVGPGAPKPEVAPLAAAEPEPAPREPVKAAVQPEPAEDSAAVTEPPKRKPGRPKKVV